MAKGTKYYAVARGRHVGIFTDWYTCSKLVYAYRNSKYKSFDTFEEAQDYMIDEGEIYIEPWELNEEKL